jgi:hypothetical protein
MDTVNTIKLCMWGALLGAFGVGCASESDAPAGVTDEAVLSCDAVPPCGGDLSGKWKVDNVCFDTWLEVVPNCGASKTKGTASSVGGIWDFAANGQFEGTYNYQGNLTLQVPLQCLFTKDCATVAEGTTWQPSCVAISDTMCECTKTVAPPPHDGLVFYKTTGTVVDISALGQFDYCVQGNSVQLTRRLVYEEWLRSGVEPPMRLTLTRM